MLTVNEAAAILRVKPGTVRTWLTQGKLTRYKAGGRTLLDESEVRGFIATPPHPGYSDSRRAATALGPSSD